jgi:carbon-monoxide dehydrogenase iron sulfur subunit
MKHLAKGIDMNKEYKGLMSKPELCTSCQRCALWCSLSHFGEMNRSRSKVYVVRREPAVDVPVTCIQCGVCISACPTGALSRTASTGAVIVDNELCSGCGTCVMACPYGVIQIDPETMLAHKCDLCNGAPACVSHCPQGAILFEKASRVGLSRREVAARAESSLVMSRLAT